MRPLKSARVGTLSKPNANNYHARYCKRENRDALQGRLTSARLISVDSSNLRSRVEEGQEPKRSGRQTPKCTDLRTRGARPNPDVGVWMFLRNRHPHCNKVQAAADGLTASSGRVGPCCRSSR